MHKAGQHCGQQQLATTTTPATSEVGGAGNDGVVTLYAVMSAGRNGVPESKFDTGLLQFITKHRTREHYKHI